MSEEFLALIFEGVFDTRRVGGEVQHWVQRPEGEEHVDLGLQRLVGRQVQIAAHHVPKPPTPMEPSRWRNIVAHGLLTYDPTKGVYTIQDFAGKVVVLDIAVFSGCYARVLAAAADAIERARDVVMAAGLAGEIDGLGKSAESLQGLMDSLVKMAGDKK